MRWALVALLAAAGCKRSAPTPTTSASGSGSSVPAATPSDAPVQPPDAAAENTGQPLQDALAEAAAKQSVALVIDHDGRIVARSVDGAFNHVLLAGPYSDAFYDLQRDLIWLRNDTSFAVLDLRLPGPAKATRLIATSDKKVLEKFPYPIEQAPNWDMSGSVAIHVGTCGEGAGLTFAWSKDGAGQLSGTETLKVVDKAWFASQEHRAEHKFADHAPRPAGKRPAVPKSIGNCNKPITEDVVGHTECRRSIHFGESSYQLVVVNAEENSCPALKCMLYDAATKRFSAVPGVPDDGRTCGPFQFDASDKYYLTGDQLCNTADLQCASIGKHDIGWLGTRHVVDNS